MSRVYFWAWGRKGRERENKEKEIAYRRGT